ncbi:hypothetical protein ACU1JV_00720 [Paenibacillus sp. T2-29]|uniref:hypothetical protein n=1 Tax=Paenibacillus TaxID=44249 RepID=UPI0039BC9AB1
MLRSIPVLKRNGKKISEVAEWLDIDTIICSKNEKINYTNRTVYITSDGEYVHCIATDQIHELLSEQSGFAITDRGTLGNLNKDHEYDEKNNNIIMCEKHVITVSTPRKSKVKEVIKKILSRK